MASRTSHKSEVLFSLLGEGMILVSFHDNQNPATIDADLNAQVMVLSEAIEQNPFPGFMECVPAYDSLGVVFNPLLIQSSRQGASVFDVVCEAITQIHSGWSDRDSVVRISGRHIRIPVCYDGPDLASLSDSHGLSSAEVISIHCSRVYSVFMMGFLPGFAYMGTVDDRIATPRHSSPRKLVAPGSVGIAGHQTGIYPMESPGGWQLIGHTTVSLFDPSAESPFLLQPGDQVEFYPVEKKFNTSDHGG